MKRSYTLLLLFILAQILICGCWDKIELEKRALVLGAAIDTGSNSKNNNNTDTSNPNSYMLTVEMPLYVHHSSQKTESDNKNDKTEKSLISSKTGTSLFEIERDLSTTLNKVLFFGHQQIIIIGEEMARNYNLKDVLKIWTRDSSYSKSIEILIAEGKGQDIFYSHIDNSPYISMFISEQLDLYKRSSKFEHINLINCLSKLYSEENMLISRIFTQENGKLTISGSGVIKNGKLVGWLDEEETRNVHILIGTIKGGDYVAKVSKENGSIVTIEIIKEKMKFSTVTTDEIPSINVDIKIKCSLVEIQEDKKIDEKYLENIQKDIAADMKQQLTQTLSKIQNQYKTDVLGFGHYLEKFHYKKWKIIEDDWENVFPDVPVSMNIEIKIKHSGLTL